MRKEPTPAPQAKRSVVVTRESAVLVKTEPESETVLIDLKDLAGLGQGFDPSLTDLELQVRLLFCYHGYCKPGFVLQANNRLNPHLTWSCEVDCILLYFFKEVNFSEVY